MHDRRQFARRHLVSLSLLAILMLVLEACESRRAAPSGANHALSARVAGLWDLEMTLDRTPPGEASQGAHRSSRLARGTLTLLESARGKEGDWLRHRPTHTGVHDMSLQPFGIQMRDASPVPALLASAVAPDSLEIALMSGSDVAAVILRGALRADSVQGIWSYQARSAGKWRGTFVLRRRRALTL